MRRYLAFSFALVVGLGAILLPSAPSPSPSASSESPGFTRKQARHAARAQWVRRTLMDDRGQIPTDVHLKARQELARLESRPKSPHGAGLQLDQWLELGPERIGGRIRAIAVAPPEETGGSSTVWVGGVAGGIWKSTDRGAHWEPMGDFLPNLAVSSIVIDPSDPDRIWVGTGESFAGVGLEGAGVFRSQDGGQTWLQLPDTASWKYVNRLAISPDSLTLLAAAEGYANDSGIYRSVDDGDNWDRRIAGLYGDVDFHPTNSSRAVAGITRRGFDAANDPAPAALLYSTNGGYRWDWNFGEPTVRLTNPGTDGNGSSTTSYAHRVETAWALNGSDDVWASLWVIDEASRGRTGGLLSSSDGGASYEYVIRPITEPGGQIGDGTPFLDDQGDYDNVVWAGRAKGLGFYPVIVGGVELFRLGLARTTLDPISNAKKSPEHGGGSIHADHHVIAAAYGYDGVLEHAAYFGNDGGVYHTSDVRSVGSNRPNHANLWERINGDLRITQFYTADAAPTDGGQRLIGGTQDNGTLYFRNTDNRIDRDGDWFTAFGGDGGGCAVDPQDDDRIYGTMQWAEEIFTSETASTGTDIETLGNIIDLDGANRPLPALSKTFPFVIDDVKDQLSPFIVSAFELDPGYEQRLYVGAYSLWRTDDAQADPTEVVGSQRRGPAWARVKDPVSASNYISVVKVDPSDSNRVWVGYDGGQLFYTDNGRSAAPTWTQVGPTVRRKRYGDDAIIESAAPWPTRKLTGIAINPRSGNHICASFGGMVEGNFWQTYDGGRTWYRGENMPELAAWDVEVHPERRETVYLATESGIITSYDRGEHWTTVGRDGPRAIRVTDLLWIRDRLYAATFGRGVFRQRVAYAGPPLFRIFRTTRVLRSNGLVRTLALDVGLVSEPPGGDPTLTELRTFVWSNQTEGEDDVDVRSPLDLQLAATDLGTTKLGRVYLALVEAKDASGTPGWRAVSAIVPRDAKVGTLLGLTVKATQDEMALSRVAPQASAAPGAKSGKGEGVPDGYSFLTSGK